jgi:hypothetical protein
MRLSKSRFTAGLQCHKLLWWRVHEPDAPEMVPSPEQQAVFDQGHRVGARACEEFPGGVLVDASHDDIEGRLEQTRAALAAGAPAIFEASFFEDDVFVAVDILERTPTGWTIVEVKSSTKVKAQYLPDAAVQTHVVRRAGLPVDRVEIMHLNRACRFPDLSNLFTRADVTEDVEALLPALPRAVESQLAMLQDACPDVPVGPQCREPYECPFIARCWLPLPAHHVSTLYGVRPSKVAALEASGYHTIFDLPDDGTLRWTADRQRRAVQASRLIVEASLRDALAPLRKPFAVLDFEAIQLAIPIWDGCRPYDQVPAQFSCHVVSEDGTLMHHEWLAEGPGDPRAAIAARLVEACRGLDVVVAYNASFESMVLGELAQAVPGHAEALNGIRARLVDALPLVREHVYHPDFGGSFSLKAVLPALVPDMDYGGLEVAGGRAASLALDRLMFGGDALSDEERARTRDALLRYCATDTLGVVRLIQRLEALAFTEV